MQAPSVASTLGLLASPLGANPLNVGFGLHVAPYLQWKHHVKNAVKYYQQS